MTLRNDITTKRELSRKGYKARKFVCRYFGSPDVERDGKPNYLQCFSDPVAAIRDIWQISEDIERLVQVFAETCIVRPSELQTRRSPSSTELHRSRRAFWRFQLCYDMCHPERVPCEVDGAKYSPIMRPVAHHQMHRIQKACFPDTDWPRHTGNKLKDFMQEFIQSLCPWEVEEFEAVRFHLRRVINRLQYSARKDPSRLKSQPALLQRLLNDPEYWQQANESPFDHLLVLKLPNYQPSRRLNSGRRPPSVAANAANFSGVPPFTSLKLLSWRMWDKERMIMRGLIDDTSDPFHFNTIFWSDDGIVRECEDAQSAHLNCWAAEVCQNDVELEQEKLRDFRLALVRGTSQ